MPVSDRFGSLGARGSSPRARRRPTAGRSSEAADGEPQIVGQRGHVVLGRGRAGRVCRPPSDEQRWGPGRSRRKAGHGKHGTHGCSSHGKHGYTDRSCSKRPTFLNDLIGPDALLRTCTTRPSADLGRLRFLKTCSRQPEPREFASGPERPDFYRAWQGAAITSYGSSEEVCDEVGGPPCTKRRCRSDSDERLCVTESRRAGSRHRAGPYPSENSHAPRGNTRDALDHTRFRICSNDHSMRK